MSATLMKRAGTVRENSRWHLTDFQRLLVVLAVASAIFLSATALGAQSIVPLLVAMVLLVGAGLGVFLLGLRFTARGTVQGHAYVIMAQPPPVGKIVGRCDMRLLVDMPGQESTMVKMRDASVPVTKWPTVGMTLPVEVSPRNPRQLRVRWELVDAHTVRTASPAEVDEAFAVPFFTDYSDKELEGLTGDLPTAVTPAVPPDVPPPRVPAELDEYFPPSDEYLLAGQDTDPDTILGDEIIIPPHLSADLSPEASARSSDFELPMRNIPQPRPAERLSERRGAAPPGGQSVTEQGSDVNGQAMGMMLVVSDLNRSLRFYRDLVGFSVVDRGANVAVLAYGGGRVLLRQLADMSPVDRRVAHLHISVSDVDASYKDLKDRGIEFVHRPRVTSRGEKLDLWAAIFRDPDGHDIALAQWRAREDAPPQA
jgi:catechol 2,3-dioxygenase-like lactoylglutathione lyase family enzyme